MADRSLFLWTIPFLSLSRDERKEILPPCFGVFSQSSAVVTVFRRGRGMLICGEFQFMFMSGEPDKREESVQENMTSQRMKRERFKRVKV